MIILGIQFGDIKDISAAVQVSPPPISRNTLFCPDWISIPHKSRYPLPLFPSALAIMILLYDSNVSGYPRM